MADQKIDFVAHLIPHSLRCKEVPKLKYWEFADKGGVWKEMYLKKTNLLKRAVSFFRFREGKEDKKQEVKGDYTNTFVPLCDETRTQGYVLWLRGDVITLHKCALNYVIDTPDTSYTTLYVQEEEGCSVSIVSFAKHVINLQGKTEKYALEIMT